MSSMISLKAQGRAGREARPDDFTALKEIGTSLEQRKSSLESNLPCSAFNS